MLTKVKREVSNELKFLSLKSNKVVRSVKGTFLNHVRSTRAEWAQELLMQGIYCLFQLFALVCCLFQVYMLSRYFVAWQFTFSSLHDLVPELQLCFKVDDMSHRMFLCVNIIVFTLFVFVRLF